MIRKDDFKLRLNELPLVLHFVVILSGNYHVYSPRQVREKSGKFEQISVAILILLKIFVTWSLGKSDY